MDILKELGIVNSEGQDKSSLNASHIARGAIDENDAVYVGIFKQGEKKGSIIQVHKDLEPFLPTLCCAFELVEFAKAVNYFAKEVPKINKEFNVPFDLSEPWNKLGEMAETIIAHTNMATLVRVNTKDLDGTKI